MFRSSPARLRRSARPGPRGGSLEDTGVPRDAFAANVSPGIVREGLHFIMRTSLVCILVSLALFAAMTARAGTAESPSANESAQNDPNHAWVDDRYAAFTNQADKLAAWIDGFFSDSRAVEDSATSLVRIRPEYGWDDDGGSDWHVRVNGRLYLPATRERLSLVFMGEEGGFEETFYDPGLTSDGDSAVGIQYQVRNEARSKFDLTAGIKSHLKGKLGARYVYLLPLTDVNRIRLSEEVFWIGGDGFGTLTRADFDRVIDENTLIRWANKAIYSEDSNGVEWTTTLGWAKRLKEKRAVRAYVFTKGETSPRYVKSYGVGTSYRRRFLRRWLYWEVEPYYEWRKNEAGDNREGVFGTDFRIEVVLGSRELNEL